MNADPFISQLADLCRAERTRAKWVLVPTHGIGRMLGDRLALDGVNWANLRFATPFSLALATAAPRLLEQGLDPLPDGLGASLLMRLLMERPAGAPAYFRPLAEQPRMGAALWATIRELRLAGVAVSALKAAAFEEPRKHAELAALLASYERELAGSKKADMADVYRVAAAHAGECPVGATDLLVEAPELGTAPPLVRAFIAVIPGQRVPCAVPRVPGLAKPRRLAGERAEQAGSSRLAFLLSPGEAPPAAPGQHLELFRAAGREAELEGVLRRILTASPSIPLDSVEVACADREAAALFWEKAQGLDLPMTIEDGVPIAVTRPLRALLGLCDWIERDLPASHLRRLLQAGDVRIVFPDGAGSGRAARILLRAESTWGRDTYATSLAALAARDRATAEEDEDLDDAERGGYRDKADQADVLRQWVAGLLDLVPVPDGEGTVALADVVHSFLAFLERHVASAAMLDKAAASAIDEALRRLLALGSFRCPLRQALALAMDSVERLSVGASGARPGHLHVSPLACAGYAGRPFTFIVGLQESGVFPSLLEDPVLLDDERSRISPDLQTSHDRVEEAVHAVVSRLAVLPTPATRRDGGICLSYSCRDLRDGRETLPSWLMLQAMRLERRAPELTYNDLTGILGTPETQVAREPGAALTDAGWWVASLKDAGAKALPAVEKAFPSLAAGRAAADARASDSFTEWDGFVPAARSLLDPRESGKPVSVTRLESLVKCPFLYFVEHGLKIDVVAGDPDRDEWLDALQRGSLLHDIFADMCREARDDGRRLDLKKDAARARAIADSKLDRLRGAMPPPSQLVFEHERDDLLRDVHLFLEFEANKEPREPVAFEVDFGQEGDGAEALAQDEPVEIALGNHQRFLLRGKIDRIDRLPDGSYEVIDYKTGKYDPAKWQGKFRGGGMLQYALYAIAAASLLRRIDEKPTVVRGVYEFPSTRGGGERVAKLPPSRAELVTVLSDLLDVMAGGAFLPSTDEGACTYCDFARACGQPSKPAQAKLDNPGNAALDAYRRLLTHD